MIGDIFKSAKQRQLDRQTDMHRKLIRKEAEMGGKLFGEVKPGGRREFFCLDEHTWVWHEEWIGPDGKRQISTTRYDIRPSSVLKAQNGQSYQEVGLQEAENLLRAINLYEKRVVDELYPESKPAVGATFAA